VEFDGRRLSLHLETGRNSRTIHGSVSLSELKARR
jgi:hypothetical protein